MKVHAVVTAAGSSRRMAGTDKLLLDVQGMPLLARATEPFLNFGESGQVVVAVNPERVAEFEQMFRSMFPDQSGRLLVTPGGEHRQHSIDLALQALLQLPGVDAGDPVMIHDGARPFITSELIETLVAALDNFDGAIPAQPVRDTIKRVNGSQVVQTEDRETLRQVQTPQAFPLGLIAALHEQARKDHFLGTDDASLLERYGRTVGWVEGPVYNLKVTVPDDLALVNHLFESMGMSIRSQP